MAVTKKDLIDRVSKKAGCSKTDAKNVVDAVFNVITESVAEGEAVQITGFGKFDKKTRKPRKCKNPSTQQITEIPERDVPVFHAGKAFKEKCSQ